MDDYKRSAHAKYSLKAHIIFVTKYRKALFTNNNLSKEIKEYFYNAANKYEYIISEIETDKDHIHILLEYTPKDSISNIVKILKQYTTYQMWKYHKEYLSELYWNRKAIWSDGYFACSIGQVSQETIKNYIRNQG